MTEAALRFDYHRSIAPMMWVFFGLACAELVVVHFLLALWWPSLALVVSAATLASIVWLVIAIASFRARPVLIEGDRLLMRVGRFREIAVPLSNIRDLRESWTGEELKSRSVLNLALITYPNVWIDLRNPAPGRRPISAVAHRLDDAPAFKTALAQRLTVTT